MKEEDIYESCKSIIYYLANEDDREVRQLKYKDFMHKFNKLQTSKKIVLKKKKPVDIIIFTVIPNELKALKRLLPINDKTLVKNIELNGVKAWEVDIERSNSSDKLHALIVYIGEAGVLECSITSMRVFHEYDCDLAVLCGIAAGVKEKIEKYSVIISEGIIDYEPQRLEPNGKITYRPDTYMIRDNKLKRDIQFMEYDSWRALYNETVSEYGGIIDGEFDIQKVKDSELKTGIIASGRKLIADGDILTTLREAIPLKKGIIAAEMESAGFCNACNEFNKTWLVIRGISDHGGEDKNDELNEKYQHIAAFGAFTALLYYLKNIYKREGEEGGSMDEF
jgi:nucleoside phosphorylase